MMFKKSAILFLAMLYLGTVSGFALNLHYCFNHLSSIRIDAPAKECSKRTGERKMSCCKDKRIDVKVKDAHQSALSVFSGKIYAAILPRLYRQDPTSLPTGFATAGTSYRGPPLSPVSAYLKNCNFRI